MRADFLFLLLNLVTFLKTSSNRLTANNQDNFNEILIEAIVKYLFPLQPAPVKSNCKSELGQGAHHALSEPCVHSIAQSQNSEMVDFTGHFPPESLNSGNFFALGSYDACLNHGGGATTYCTATVDISPILFEESYSARLLAIKEDFPLPPSIPGINYYQGWCLPSTCDPTDALALTYKALSILTKCHIKVLQDFTNLTKSAELLKVDEVVCSYKGSGGEIMSVGYNYYRHNSTYNRIDIKEEKKIKQKSTAIGTIYFAIFIALALFGLAVDTKFINILRLNHNYERFIDCFSPVKNLGIILDPKCFEFWSSGPKSTAIDGERKTNKLDIFYGIRVMCMIYIMRGHTFGFGLHYVRADANTNSNGNSVQDPLTSLLSFLYFGFITVDVFLFISGFLAAATVPHELAYCKTIIKPWLKYAINRIARLTPLYQSLLIFIIFIAPYLGSGPFWPAPNTGGLYPPCQTHWWTNILFLNNLVACQKLCAPWNWYIAADFQYHIILVPIFVRIFAQNTNKDRARTALVLTITLTVCYNFILSYRNGFNSMAIKNGIIMPDFFYKFYIKPHVRMVPFLMGLLLGCEHYIAKSPKPSPLLENPLLKLEHPKSINNCKFEETNFILPALALSSMIMPTFVWAHFNKVYNMTIVPLPFLSAVVGTFITAIYRPVWSLILYLFLDRILRGDPNYNIFKKVLSCPIWIPFSNLNYATYLIHPLIMQIIYRQLRTPNYSTPVTCFLFFMNFTVLSYVLAFLPTLFIEIPFRNLAKSILYTKDYKKTI